MNFYPTGIKFVIFMYFCGHKFKPMMKRCHLSEPNTLREQPHECIYGKIRTKII